MARRPGNIQVASGYAGARRRLRKPRHTFNIEHRPFQIQPFMIAPVLPGETMQNLLLQSRAYSDPIKSPHIGWWLDYHFFYVKHRDLAGRADFTAMMLDPDYSLAGYKAAADVEFYHGANMVTWLKLCYIEIVEQYFRDEADGAWNAYTIGNLATAQINGESWLNSALLDDDFIIDVPPNIDLDASGTTNAEEVQRALKMWELQRLHNMTDMTYEDFLATYGVKSPDVELHVPELIRSTSSWTYPTNTIDPTSGAPRSAVSWAIAERADKDRFFREPGFIVGVTVAKPKVYLKNLDGAAAGALDTALTWLPAVMHDDPRTSLKKEAATTGPLQTIVTDAGGYWFDVKDLFLYGDQFLNVALTATDRNIVALPDAALENKKYPSSADVDAMFVSASPANKVRADGAVALTIAGRVQETTPGMPAT